MSLHVPSDELARLRHLSDVANRELLHLLQTTARLFAQDWTAEELARLCQDIEFSERMDAFVARFGRLQDLLGDKWLPAWLRAMQEKPASVLENLDRGEKLGIVRSTDEWLAVRKLRNLMVHEYLHLIHELHAALHAARAGVDALAFCTEQLTRRVAALPG